MLLRGSFWRPFFLFTALLRFACMLTDFNVSSGCLQSLPLGDATLRCGGCARLIVDVACPITIQAGTAYYFWAIGLLRGKKSKIERCMPKGSTCASFFSSVSWSSAGSVAGSATPGHQPFVVTCTCTPCACLFLHGYYEASQKNSRYVWGKGGGLFLAPVNHMLLVPPRVLYGITKQ